MDNNNTFSFKFIDIATYTKEGEKKAIVVAYCNYGFICNIFTDEKKAINVKTHAINHKDDITPLVKVSYNRKADKFAYYLND